MKKIAFSLLSLVALASASIAGQTSYVSSGKDSKEYKGPAPLPPTCFSDTELAIDTFATYKIVDGNGYHDEGFGGGVAVNYFFARYIGIGVEGHWSETGPDDVVLHHTNALLTLRFPIDSICLAPYVIGGGGYSFDGDQKAAGFAGGGLEFRVVPNKVGIFGDGRYTWTEDANNYGLVRLGVRVVF